MADVVCVGIIMADIVAKPVDVWPDRGKLEFTENMQLHIGGCAANTAVSLAKIGIDTAIIGKVGDDDFGEFLISSFKLNSIDARGIVKDKDTNTNTSATMVMVHSDSERSFIHYLGANAELTEDDIDFDIIKNAKILHIAGAFLMPKFDGTPTARVFKHAKEWGIITSLDTCWDSKGRWLNLIAPCLPYVDVFLPSIEEAKMITGETQPHKIAEVLLSYGIGIVGLKMGNAGSFIKTKDEEIEIPPYRVDAVDATGAGDAFVAGFLTGLIKGWDLRKTGKFANAVGALCVTAIGTTSGIKSIDETLKFMNGQ